MRRLKHGGWGYRGPGAYGDADAGGGGRDQGAVWVRWRGRGAGAAREGRVARGAVEAPARLGDLFSDERYERVSRALGKAYRDVVRGFRGEFANPPDLVAFPRDESEIERC